MLTRRQVGVAGAGVVTWLMGLRSSSALARPVRVAELPSCEDKRQIGPWLVTSFENYTSMDLDRSQIQVHSPAVQPSWVDSKKQGTLQVVVGFPDLIENKELEVQIGSDRRSLVAREFAGRSEGGQSYAVEIEGQDQRGEAVRVTVNHNGSAVVEFEYDPTAYRQAWEYGLAQQVVLATRLQAGECEAVEDGAPCFVTTACVGLLGLDDDCFELRALRRFRDHWLANTPSGRADIDHYYAAAPAILTALRDRGDEHQLLLFYATHVLPSAVAAALGLNQVAHRLYRDMMRRLEGRYSAA